jgi:hypothetical protein
VIGAHLRRAGGCLELLNAPVTPNVQPSSHRGTFERRVLKWVRQHECPLGKSRLCSCSYALVLVNKVGHVTKPSWRTVNR